MQRHKEGRGMDGEDSPNSNLFRTQALFIALKQRTKLTSNDDAYLNVHRRCCPLRYGESPTLTTPIVHILTCYLLALVGRHVNRLHRSRRGSMGQGRH